MKDNTITPDARIKSALRMLWLRSKERSECLKKANYECSKCGVHASVAKDNVVKIEVHHKHGILNWDEIYKVIRAQLLVSGDKLECLCKECHKKETYGV